jgi:deoxyribodipyrimidine photolyase-related protein
VSVTPRALVLFPHQLFAGNVALAPGARVFLVEDALFFRQYPFHQQKLVLHRASMQVHATLLRKAGRDVTYIDSAKAPDMAQVVAQMTRAGITQVEYIDPVDDWLERRLLRELRTPGCSHACHPTPMFLTSKALLVAHFGGHRRPSMATFYAAQRRELGILVEDGQPVGGRWSFDTENRKRVPKALALPTRAPAPTSTEVRAACAYVRTRFPDNPGRAQDFAYPVTYAAAGAALDTFLREHLAQFGDYEDAMVADNAFLFHSVLTPMLNIGLLTPQGVVDRTLEHAREHATPLNALEGFLRQVIGWREFVRGAYAALGRAQRTRNFWGHTRPLPQSFWTGTTGIGPIDTVIRRVLQHGYAHHIERLMVLANFMLLCEFDPDDVYRWFMVFFVDAYDWVMVPNVYGMGLFADGGMITTKPYIGGSNYLARMSDFPKGEWCATWDGLFWRFIDKHRGYFTQQPRLAMMGRLVQRMPVATLAAHRARADAFLDAL